VIGFGACDCKAVAICMENFGDGCVHVSVEKVGRNICVLDWAGVV